MPRYLKILFFAILVVALAAQCNEKGPDKETILEGKATIVTDETLAPIVEDQIAVFESAYNAKIKLISKSEAETVNALLKNVAEIAILSRKLTAAEMKVFENKKIIPKITQFASDGIVFIRNKRNKDTLIAIQDVLRFMKGDSVEGIKGLVFDNPNSSTSRYLCNMAGVATLPSKGIYSFGTNNDAIKYVAENDGMVGVIGLNWLSQPFPEMLKYTRAVSVLSVKGLNGSRYYEPSQNNIAEGNYPLARDLFVVNCQGFQGLGMGFASFIAGERGQRIILKSGLLPIRIPGRKIIIRKEIEKESK
jgi:phosphate transport system substrate-binding protein